jgi:hypothetical protein
MNHGRGLLAAGAAVYFAAIAAVAVGTGAADHPFWLVPFFAFVPIGATLLLLLGRRRWGFAIIFSALGAAWIDAARSVWMPDGNAELTSVLWAALGATVGVIAAAVISLPRRRAMPSHNSHIIVTEGTSREIPRTE